MRDDDVLGFRFQATSVSNRQRVARMRRLAVRALDAYPLVDRELRFIADEENATFRVDATAADGRGRFSAPRAPPGTSWAEC